MSCNCAAVTVLVLSANRLAIISSIERAGKRRLSKRSAQLFPIPMRSRFGVTPLVLVTFGSACAKKKSEDSSTLKRHWSVGDFKSRSWEFRVSMRNSHHHLLTRIRGRFSEIPVIKATLKAASYLQSHHSRLPN
jgi:hypothetical protein